MSKDSKIYKDLKYSKSFKNHNNHNFKRVATINSGVTPTGMAITKDGKYAYVCNNNNYMIDNQDSVMIIDLKTFLPVKTIYHPSFNQPYTITLHQNKAYVTNSEGTTITVINTQNNKIIDVIDGFDGPSGIVIHNDIGYVINYGAGVRSGNGNTVRTVNLITNKIFGEPIIVGLAPACVNLSTSKNHVYTINYIDGNPNTGTMTKISTKTNSVVDTLGPFPKGLSGPFYFVIRSNKAYVTNFGSNNFTPIGNTLSIVDLNKKTIIKNIKVGIQPSGIIVSPDKRYAYVSNYNTLYASISQNPPQFSNLTPGQGTINVIDLKNYKVISTIAADQSPGRLEMSPNGKYLYVTNFTSNTFNVIKIF